MCIYCVNTCILVVNKVTLKCLIFDHFCHNLVSRENLAENLVLTMFKRILQCIHYIILYYCMTICRPLLNFRSRAQKSSRRPSEIGVKQINLTVHRMQCAAQFINSPPGCKVFYTDEQPGLCRSSPHQRLLHRVATASAIFSGSS